MITVNWFMGDTDSNKEMDLSSNYGEIRTENCVNIHNTNLCL